MQVEKVTSEEGRRRWSELIDRVLSGEVFNVTRHERSVAVVISPKLWEKILADYERLNDLEDLVAGYRAKIAKLEGRQESIRVTPEMLEEWMAEDEPVRA
jgi:prevent-host-death family protein